MNLVRSARRRVRHRIDRLLEERSPYRVVDAGGRVGILTTGLESVQLGGANNIGPRSSFKGGPVTLGFASTVGDGCYLSGEVTLGRYTQIGPSVTIVDRDHPTTHLTSFTGRSLFDGQQKSFQEVRPVTIGNDVWVGANSVILAGAVLGDGSVVAAGSVVRGVVEPFAVVAGVPARQIGQRFPSETASMIGRLRWWDWEPSDLAAIAELFAIDSKLEPERFRSVLLQALESVPSADQRPSGS